MHTEPFRAYTFDADSASVQGFTFSTNARGDLTIEDRAEPINLFQTDAVQEIVSMFGERKADEMLGEAAEMIDSEIFARRMRNVMLNRKR